MTRDLLLGLLYPLIAAIFAGTFFTIWTMQRQRWYVATSGLTYLLFCAGFALFYAHSQLELASIRQLAVLSVYFGVSALVWSLGKRVNQPISVNALLCISVVTVVCYQLLYYQGAVTGVAEAGAQLGSGLLLCWGAWRLRYALRTDGIERLTFWLMMLISAQLGLRPVLAWDFGQLGIFGEPHVTTILMYLDVMNGLLALAFTFALLVLCVTDLIQEARDHSNIDSLTGVRNRRGFDHAVDKIMRKLDRAALPVAVVIADIDHFKSVNDRFGHQTGDAAIAEFADMLALTSRGTDIVGRVGGEEFCVFLWNADREGGRLFAEAMRNAFANKGITGLPLGERLTASFGVAERWSDETFSELYCKRCLGSTLISG